ncbi:MAG: hypothetical protein NXH85_16160 [Pseudomonadaceae bacterium]|nr:hypothetical protein [Pseudomonadaceae bacterium]
MLNRRQLLAAAAVLPASSAILSGSRAAYAADIAEGLLDSDLVYLSPIQSSGALSSCQAEVWFQYHDGAVYVVTSDKAWRARAVSSGLTQARMWVGDVGVWTDSDGKYVNLPSTDVSGALIDDEAQIKAVLKKMGRKYPASWLVWGPRFRKGLADGSRVMLRYDLA